jgi:hypothetical protein
LSDTEKKMGIQWDSISVIDCKKAYDSLRGEILYIILIKLDTPGKLVRPAEMYLKE